MLRTQQNYKTNLSKQKKPKLCKEAGLKLKRKTKSEKKEERKNTLLQKLIGLLFYCFPNSNLSQFNKTVNKNFKLKDLGPEKVPMK